MLAFLLGLEHLPSVATVSFTNQFAKRLSLAHNTKYVYFDKREKKKKKKKEEDACS